ncbi:hypothetical protein BC835DRAFT_1419493 [Cytidiella melzeri]|nr:hypothetical protein BC835DRAFT_1419493 [Cytidiella melzeri]
MRASTTYSGFHASTATAITQSHSCKTFAAQDAVKHVALGGFWYDAEKKTWRSAGHGVRDYMRDHPEEKAHLGYKETKPVISGSAHLPKSQQRHSMSVTWAQTYSSTVESMTLINGDKAVTGKDILVKYGDNQYKFARVIEMLVPLEMSPKFLTFCSAVQDRGHTHEKLRVPRLTLTQDTALLTLQDIICAVNTQHNCTDSDSQCIGVTLHPTRQERTFTEHRTKQIAQHAETPHFLLNIYSIHTTADC